MTTGDWTLVIDTATGVNVGLAQGSDPIGSRTELSSRQHVERLQPMIDELLADAGVAPADLGLVAVGIGPGPFTGLRIGIVTARTLGLVGGVPVRGFGTLDAIALGWLDGRPADGEFVVTTDARRKELYWATYAGSPSPSSGPFVTAPSEVPDLPVIGPGHLVQPELFAGRVPDGAPAGLDAALVAARIGELPDTGLEPAYLRKPDAEPPRTRKSALAGGRLRLPRERGPRQ